MRTLTSRLLSRRVLVDFGALPADMVAHWDAALLSSSPVTTWPDRTGNGWDMIAPAETNEPTLVSNALGKFQAVRFAGDDDYLRSTLSLSQPVSIAVVARHANNDAAQRAVIGSNSGGNAGVVVQTIGGVWRTFAGSDLVSAFPVTDEWVSITAVFQNSGMLGIDGELAAGTVNTRAFQNARLGAFGTNSTNGTAFWDGDIVEAVVWDRALSVDELLGVHGFFAAKYRLT